MTSQDTFNPAGDPTVVIPSGPEGQPPSEESEMDRFQDVASKLVKVPKKELDEKRKSD